MQDQCPSCQTLYAVTPRDIGRRIACRKCQAILIVDESGLRYESIPATVPANEATALPGSRSWRADARKLFMRQLSDLGLVADGATIWFTTGTILVIWFLFMPVVAGANVESRQGIYEEEMAAHEADVKNGRSNRQSDENWNRRREYLESEIRLAESAAKRSIYWDRYGLLAGFLTLAIGAVRFLGSGQSPAKRVVGAVIISAEMLLVFVKFVIRG